MTFEKKEVTLSELLLLIESHSKKKRELSNDLYSLRTKEEIEEIDGRKTDVSFNKQTYKEVYDKYVEVCDSLVGLELLKNETNQKTFAVKSNGKNISLTEALLKVKSLRERLTNIENALSLRESKVRRNDGVGSQSYYKITSYNFDKDELSDVRECLENEIKELESGIQLANSNTAVCLQ